MSPARFLRLFTVWFALLVSADAAESTANLATHFAAPPDSAKPWVWWHWMNGNVSRSGITKDLEAIKAAGFGGVILFEESDRIPPGPVRYLSQEHLDLIAHAASECTRVGLKFGFQNCPGWSSTGGPWVTPEQAMKHVTWSEQAVVGGKKLSLTLARPSTMVRPFTDLGPPKRYGFHDYYRDVAVLAFPTPQKPDWRLDDWQKKMGYLTDPTLRDQRTPAPAGAAIPKQSVRILSTKIAEDGRLEWDAPPGSWTIVRFGYTLTEHQNRESPTTGATGLEIDKLSSAAVDFHWANFVTKILDAAARNGNSPVTTVLMDSYEPLTQTWTPDIRAEFQQRRGYDLWPYLLCLTGRALDNVDETERFLWDYRRTLADLAAENYYGRFAEHCRQRGLKFASEGYGYYGTFFDDFQMATKADIPMGEFWAGVIKWHNWSGKIAASAADIMDRHLVGAEAFTAGNDQAAWRWHPYTLKAQGDYFFCRGINRFYIQASVHQPWADHIQPGMTFGPNGMQMNRNNTWFRQSRDWVSYLARCEYLLQQGQLVTDVFYCYGDNAPGTMRPVPAVTSKGPKGVPWGTDAAPDVWTPLPAGRDFHVGNGEVIRRMHVNAQGELEVASGARYRVLLLPNDDRIEYDLLAKIAKLVQDGATVLGPRPVRAPNLASGRDADRKIAALAEQVWGPIDGKLVTSHRYGKGTMYFGVTLEQILEDRGIPRDFEVQSLGRGALEAANLDYIHRRLSDGDFYFVSNQRNAPASAECVFRASGTPEIWRPETGTVEPALIGRQLANGRTALTLNFAPAESCFVVFRRTGKAARFTGFTRNGEPVTDDQVARLRSDEPGRAVVFEPGSYALADVGGKQHGTTVSALSAALDLSRDWQIEFPAGSGAPAQANLAQLASYTDQTDEGIRYFSGTATYTREFDLTSAAAPGDVAELDLGDVQVIAELAVNGHDYGILWKPPFRRDITAALHRGRNVVTVKVTNLWRNRLIGDAKIAGFTAESQSRLVDQMLAGNTRVTESGQAKDVAQPSDEFYPVPDWVRAGKPNPDPRLHTFTPFAFLHSGTPLVPSGLLGPVRLHWGRNIDLQ
jgi:hypothetical protein